jgi:hypothetical protein
MEHDPCLVDLRTWVEAQQVAGADRGLVELGQHVLAVFEWMEMRLDVLDEREGA